MNKITTAALAGLVAVTASANASVSSWEGLGNIGAAFKADVQDVFSTLPTAVTSHKNAIYMELGLNDLGFVSGFGMGSDGNGTGEIYQDLAPRDPWGGAHLELGPGVLAVWMNRPYSEGTFQLHDWWNNTPSAGGVDSTIYTPNQTMDLIYGWDLSDQTTLAFGLNRATYFDGYKNESTAGTSSSDDSVSDLGILLGVAQKEVGPFSLLEVGLAYNMLSGSNEDKTPTTTNKFTRAGSDMDLRVGADLAGEDGAFGRLELGLTMDNASYKVEPNTPPAATAYVEAKDNGFGYNLGYAVGKSGEKGMGLLGLMLASGSVSTDMKNGYGPDDNVEVTMNELKLVAGAAAEAVVNSWLTLRGGFSSNLFYSMSAKETDGLAGARVTETWSYDSPNNWNGPFNDVLRSQASFGTTLTFGNFSLDGVLNQDVLYTGGGLFSGVPGALSTKVSGTFVY